MKLSVLLTTIYKRTLLRTLQSLEKQAWEAGDEVLLVSDDCHDEVIKLITDTKFNMPIRHIPIKDGPHKDFGHTPRGRTMKKASGNYICHLDDDDIYLSDAIKNMRQSCKQDLKAVHLFRMIRYSDKRIIWTKEGQLKRKHISTQCICHPNKPSTFGVWGPYYGGDFQFCAQTCAKVGKVIWDNIITSVWNPDPELSLEQVYKWYDSLSN